MGRIQEDLRAWCLARDRDAGGRALDALAREWRPRVRLWLASPTPDEVEEVLQDALVACCSAEDGQRPRALAPDDAENPAAWRRKVLRNWLTDRARRAGRRRHAEWGLAQGLTPAVEAEAWRHRRPPDAAAASASLTEPRPAPPPAPDDPSASLLLPALRRDLVRLLPGVAVRRRVLVALVLGADPSPWVAELARELAEATTDTQARVDRALAEREGGPGDELPLAFVRVCWPTELEGKARESARKSLERAADDLRRLLGGGR